MVTTIQSGDSLSCDADSSLVEEIYLAFDGNQKSNFLVMKPCSRFCPELYESSLQSLTLFPRHVFLYYPNIYVWIF